MKALIARLVIPAAALLTGVTYGGSPEASQHNEQADYNVINLSSLGGTESGGNSINNLGWVAGFSNLPGTRPGTLPCGFMD